MTMKRNKNKNPETMGSDVRFPKVGGLYMTKKHVVIRQEKTIYHRMVWMESEEGLSFLPGEIIMVTEIDELFGEVKYRCKKTNNHVRATEQLVGWRIAVLYQSKVEEFILRNKFPRTYRVTATGVEASDYLGALPSKVWYGYFEKASR